MDYAGFVTALSALIEVDEDDADLVAILPTIIDYAEGRCYRELGLLASNVTTAGTLSANNRQLALPTTNGHVLEVDYINILDASSVRHQAIPSSRPVIDSLWPSNTAQSALTIPELFARISDTQVLVGPPPGSSWSCEVIHTIRPTPLSAVNTTTFLVSYLPDLFIAAAMVFASAWQKNFGVQSGDPKEAQSWEVQFLELLKSASIVEMKKKYEIAMSS